MAQLREHTSAFREKGAQIAVVGLGDANYARFFREKTRIDFPLLRRDNMQARRRASAAGHKQHRLGKDPFQLGGSFVFAPENKDLFVHVSKTFGDNANPKDMLAALG